MRPTALGVMPRSARVEAERRMATSARTPSRRAARATHPAVPAECPPTVGTHVRGRNASGARAGRALVTAETASRTTETGCSIRKTLIASAPVIALKIVGGAHRERAPAVPTATSTPTTHGTTTSASGVIIAIPGAKPTHPTHCVSTIRMLESSAPASPVTRRSRRSPKLARRRAVLWFRTAATASVVARFPRHRPRSGSARTCKRPAPRRPPQTQRAASRAPSFRPASTRARRASSASARRRYRQSAVRRSSARPASSRAVSPTSRAVRTRPIASVVAASRPRRRSRGRELPALRSRSTSRTARYRGPEHEPVSEDVRAGVRHECQC